MYRTLETVFHRYPNTSNFVKNTPLGVVFLILFSVFRYPDKTLSIVFDILLPPNHTTEKTLIVDVELRNAEIHVLCNNRARQLTLKWLVLLRFYPESAM